MSWLKKLGNWIEDKWDKYVANPFSNVYHHLFLGDHNSIEDRYCKKERDWYKEQLSNINQKYNLLISDNVIDYQAIKYGEKKRDDKYSGVSFSLNYNSNLSANQNLVSNFVSNGVSAINNYFNSNLNHNLSELEFTKRQIRLQKNTLIDKRESLTQILMNNPFAIFANGVLYKKGRPGSKSYDPLTPYEPYKYITGHITYNEYDDILMGRSHFKLAGNRDYFNNVWEEPQWIMPDKNRKNKQLEIYVFARQKQFNDGFEKINELGWVYGDLNSLKKDRFKELIRTLPKKFNTSKYSGF